MRRIVLDVHENVKKIFDVFHQLQNAVPELPCFQNTYLFENIISNAVKLAGYNELNVIEDYEVYVNELYNMFSVPEQHYRVKLLIQALSDLTAAIRLKFLTIGLVDSDGVSPCRYLGFYSSNNFDILVGY